MSQVLPRLALPWDLRLGDSIAILGMRGTGKTELAKSLYKVLLDAHRYAVGYVIDTNANGDFSGWSGAYDGFDVPIIGPGPRGRQVVWQPPYDDKNAYESFFERLYDHRVPSVVLIDELSCLGGQKEKHDFYARLLKRGRARSGFAGITVISLSQELAQAAKVPRQTFSQMVHFVRFYVQHPYDIMEANRLLHIPNHVQPEHEHGFWHARFDRPPVRPVYYRGMEQLGL